MKKFIILIPLFNDWKSVSKLLNEIDLQINNWDAISDSDKSKILCNFLNIDINVSNLIEYFDNYVVNLSNNTLNFYIKGVVKDKF